MLDEQLVDEALAGSQSAFRELVRRFERPVFNLVARMVHDQTLAEDLAQEAFIKAFSRLDTYRPEQGKFSNWLFKIAHNTAIDHLRRHAPETVSLEAPQDEEGRGGLAAVLSDHSVEDPASAAERRDMARSLERAISRLRPEYREAVVLFYLEGATYQEICDVTGLPLGTVKTNLHRARKELAGEMSAMGWGAETGSAPGS